MQPPELIPQGFARRAAKPSNLPRDEVSRLERYHLPVGAECDSAKLPFREVSLDGDVHAQRLILHPVLLVEDEVGQFWRTGVTVDAREFRDHADEGEVIRTGMGFVHDRIKVSRYACAETAILASWRSCA